MYEIQFVGVFTFALMIATHIEIRRVVKATRQSIERLLREAEERSKRLERRG